MGRQYRIYILFAILVTFVTCFLVFKAVPISPYVTGLVSLSAATFFLYGFDEEDADRYEDEAQNRVPEKVLLAMIWLGGFAGAWLGMIVFCHKYNPKHLDFWLSITLAPLLHFFVIRPILSA